MPDGRHGTPNPTRRCRGCGKVIAQGEGGGGVRWELCWRCAEKYFPDQLVEIQEKCGHGAGATAALEHDAGVCHREVQQCEDCGLKFEGEWVVCDCPDRRGNELPTLPGQ